MEMFNIYCDESCHLENDNKRLMVLGAVWCPFDKAHEIAKRIREIKEKHFNTHYRETKWNKVSQAKLEFYLDLIDYFFDESNLHFRAIIADKTNLDHGRFRQSLLVRLKLIELLICDDVNVSVGLNQLLKMLTIVV